MSEMTFRSSIVVTIIVAVLSAIIGGVITLVVANKYFRRQEFAAMVTALCVLDLFLYGLFDTVICAKKVTADHFVPREREFLMRTALGQFLGASFLDTEKKPEAEKFAYKCWLICCTFFDYGGVFLASGESPDNRNQKAMDYVSDLKKDIKTSDNSFWQQFPRLNRT